MKPTQAAINDLKSTNSTKVLSSPLPVAQAAGRRRPWESPRTTLRRRPLLRSWLQPKRTQSMSGSLAATRPGQDRKHFNVPTLVADGSVDRLDPVRQRPPARFSDSKGELEFYSDAGHAFLFQKVIAFVLRLRRSSIRTDQALVRQV